MIKGIIFDFDGLILDTETPELQAWKELFQSFNIDFPFRDYSRLVGHTYDDSTPLKILQTKLKIQLNEQELFDKFKKRKIFLIDQESLCPGVLNYLQNAEDMNLLVGLASSAKRDWVDYYINKHQIYHYFDCIKTIEDVSHPKPNPELFIQALSCMQIKPEEAIVFEDSFNGITAAKNAGVFTIAVPNPVTKYSDFSHADRILEKLSDISLENLIVQTRAM